MAKTNATAIILDDCASFAAAESAITVYPAIAGVIDNKNHPSKMLLTVRKTKTLKYFAQSFLDACTAFR